MGHPCEEESCMSIKLTMRQLLYNMRKTDASDLHIDPGCDLMEYFLRSGLAGTRGR